MSVAFDTLRAARRLRDEGGFEEKQAAILVDIFAQAMAESLATKEDLQKTETALRSDLEKTETALRSDLEKTETALRSDMAALRSDMERMEGRLRSEIAGLRSDMGTVESALRADLEKLEQRMTIRLGTMMVAGFAIVVALLKLL